MSSSEMMKYLSQILFVIGHFLFTTLDLESSFVLGHAEKEYFSQYGAYIGCFQDGCLVSDFNVSYDPEVRNSPDNCNLACSNHGYPYVGIHNRTRCSCFCEISCTENMLQDDLCGIPCPGDIDHFCGGVHEISIYIVHASNFSKCERCVHTQANSSKDPSDETPGTSSSSMSLITVIIVLSVLLTLALVIIVVLRMKYSTGRYPSQSSAPHSPTGKEHLSDKGEAVRYSAAKDDPKGTDLYHSYEDALPSVKRISRDARSDGEGYLVPECKSGASKVDAGEYHSYNYPDTRPIVSQSEADKGRYSRGPGTSLLRSTERKGSSKTDMEGYLVPEVKSNISQKEAGEYHSYNYPDTIGVVPQSSKDRGRGVRGPDTGHFRLSEQRRSMQGDTSDSSSGLTPAYEKNIIRTKQDFSE